MLRSFAQQHHLTQSALLKKVLEAALLQTIGLTTDDAVTPVEQVLRDARVYVRLRPEDHLLLRERATGRGMAAATYASILVRAHLRSVVPIPERELAELKRAVAALGMIGRNLNQIARVANSGGSPAGPSAQDLRNFLKVCEALRSYVKRMIQANAASWESGNAETPR
ncbi:MAG: hypothetical protein JWO52_4021 [Gammaproteobacteria bacterium]|nr:hypothetical protein [Gammaproteobacteria bacterium]